MKTSTTHLFFGILICLMVFGWPISYAQQTSESHKTKIIIIKKTNDDDGNEVIEKIIKEEGDLTDGEIEDLINQALEDDELKIELRNNEDGLYFFDGEDDEKKLNLRFQGDDLYLNGDLLDFDDLQEWEGDDLIIKKLQEGEKFNWYLDDDLYKGFEIDIEKFQGGESPFFQDGPFLGVRVVASDQGGVEITSIIPGSGAEEAELKAGDLIISLNGNGVLSYNSLVREIRKYEPGEEVELRVERNEEEIMVKATLTERTKVEGLGNRFGHDERHGFNHFKMPENLENDYSVFDCIQPKVMLGIYGMPVENGVEITEVIDETAAEEAGLLKGDIITTIDGKQLDDVGGISDVIKDMESGQEVLVEYIREGQNNSVKAKLKTAPPNRLNNYFKRVHPIKKFGKEDAFMRGLKKVESSKPQLGVMIENLEDGEGVEIVGLISGSAAELAGLMDGDVLLAINEVKTSNIDELIDAIQIYKPGDEVEVKYLREGKSQMVKLILDAKPVRAFAFGSCNKPALSNDELLEQNRIVILKRLHPEDGSVLDNSQVSEGALELSSFEMFPNPSDGMVNLAFTSDSKNPVTIMILDIAGKEMVSEDITDFNGEYRKSFDLTSQPEGAYMLAIVQDGRLFNQKIILSKN